MPVTIQIEDAALDAELARLENRLKDTTPALMEVAEEMVERIKQRFATSRIPTVRPGRRWRNRRC